MINNFWGFSGNTENYKTSIIIRGPNIKSQEDIFFAFIRLSASKSLKMIDFPYHCKRRGWILKNPEYFFSTSTFFPYCHSLINWRRGKAVRVQNCGQMNPMLFTGLKTLDPNWRQHPISAFLSKIYLLWPQSPVQIFLSSHSQTNFVAPNLWNSSHVMCYYLWTPLACMNW